MVAASSAPRSDIGARQNSPGLQNLLRGRQWRWRIAARWQIAQLLLLILVPAVLLLVGTLAPPLKPGLSFVAVLVTLLDIGLVDRQYRQAIKSAARSSECFDVALFSLEWNSLSAGKRPTPEDQSKSERAWLAQRSRGELQNWYSPAIDRAPLAIARLICQRTNLTYDSGLRRDYVAVLTAILLTGAIGLVVFGLLSGASFRDFVIGTWVPVAPFLFWLLRELFRQSDAVEANDPGIKEAEDILRRVARGGCDDQECASISRLIQNAIFTRRASTPLLFPGIYRLRRGGAENSMKDAAEHWIAELGYGVSK